MNQALFKHFCGVCSKSFSIKAGLPLGHELNCPHCQRKYVVTSLTLQAESENEVLAPKHT